MPWKPATYSVTTDAEGRFELQLPRGRWELRVMRAGYREYSELRYFVGEGVVERRIALLRAPQ